MKIRNFGVNHDRNTGKFIHVLEIIVLLGKEHLIFIGYKCQPASKPMNSQLWKTAFLGCLRSPGLERLALQ